MRRLRKVMATEPRNPSPSVVSTHRRDVPPRCSQARIEVILAETEELRSAVADIRIAVFVREQGIALEEEFDPDDLRAMHVLALSSGAPAGTARLLRDEHLARIGRIAVLPPCRRCGVGSALLRFLLDHCASLSVARVVLHAQIQAVPFYQKHGFTVASGPFDEAGIPHCRMELTL